jgi:predicted transcriptional regulator of viral defense system
MSTGLANSPNTKIKNNSRFAEIARLNEVMFHTGDLANLWNITNKNTLYTTIKRYIKSGLLFRIQKGFYSTKRPSEIDPLVLGIKALHSYAYVSTETILQKHGITQQENSAITLISAQTKHFTVAGNKYYSRKLPDKFLYQANGIITADNTRQASVERAVADLLYFNKHAYFDGAGLIDWGKVHSIQKEIGYPVINKQ